MAFETKYTRKKRNNATYKSKHSEDVKNFYVRRPRMNRTDEQMYRSRTNDYGKKPHGDEGPLPIWISGFNI